MNKANQIYLFIVLITFGLIFYAKYFFIFFTQDDFLLINYFTEGNFVENLSRAILSTEITSWRPIFNLYFFILGTIFDRHYFFYHLVSLLVHVASSYFVFRIVRVLYKSNRAALISSIVYLTASAFFHSVVWISGFSTELGFLLFSISFYFLVLNRKLFSAIFICLAVMASEAMFFGLFVFWLYCFLFKKKAFNRFMISISILVTGITALLVLHSPNKTSGDYAIIISESLIGALKYYLLRVLGFGEGDGDVFPSLMVIVSLVILASQVFITTFKKRGIKDYLFPAGVIFFGLFPFVLIPNHLAAYYMNISIFGAAIIFGIASLKSKYLIPVATLLMVVASYLNINAIAGNSWVVKRANVSQSIVEDLQKKNYPAGERIVFENINGVDSREIYIALGGGAALDFWFKDKNYSYCFEFQPNCP